jgi:hypothetical protein
MQISLINIEALRSFSISKDEKLMRLSSLENHEQRVALPAKQSGKLFPRIEKCNMTIRHMLTTSFFKDNCQFRSKSTGGRNGSFIFKAVRGTIEGQADMSCRRSASKNRT